MGVKRSLERFFFEIRGEIDQEWVFIDGSYARAHQHASGARRGHERAIGPSRGGPTTKIHMAADANGNPINFIVTGGDVHDSKVANNIIDELDGADYLVADKGYDSDAIRSYAKKNAITPCIPRRSNSIKANPGFDSYLYKLRHMVENLFARLKHFRSIATRFDKLAQNYRATIYLACSLVWFKVK